MTLDPAQLGQTIASLGATGLLAVAVVVVWRRLMAREDRWDAVWESIRKRDERIIAHLTGQRPEDPGKTPDPERRDRDRAA